MIDGAVTSSRRSAKTFLKNGYLSCDMMDEPARLFYINLVLESRSLSSGVPRRSRSGTKTGELDMNGAAWEARTSSHGIPHRP